jgi:hypothetical protein
MHWELTGAVFENPGGYALDASDSRIAGYVNLNRTSVDGEVSFSRAKIEGVWVLVNTVRPERMRLDLRFADIWVIKDERLADWPPAGHLHLEGLVYDHFDDDSPLDVEDRLKWLARQYAPPGNSHAAGQATRRLHDPSVLPASYHDLTEEATTNDDVETSASAASDNQDASASDPEAAAEAPRQMVITAEELDGTEISSANGPADPVTVPEATGRRYVTQPYTQLASVYRAIGQDEQASRVLVARAERLGELAPALSAQGLWYRYIGRLIGYGYEPFRAVKIGTSIVILGAVVFGVGRRRNLMAETKLAEHVLSAESEPRLISPTYPRFNALVYSLDVFLPFVDLQQICYWLPGESASGPRRARNCLLHIGPWSLKWSAMLRGYFWFQTLAGWTLTTLLAAAVTGIVKS